MSYIDNGSGYLSPQILSKDKRERSFHYPYTVSHSQSHSYQQHYSNHNDSIHRKSLDFTRFQTRQNDMEQRNDSQALNLDNHYTYDADFNDLVTTSHSSLVASPHGVDTHQYWHPQTVTTSTATSLPYDEQQWRRPSDHAIDTDSRCVQTFTAAPAALSPQSSQSSQSTTNHIPIFMPESNNQPNDMSSVQSRHYQYPSDTYHSNGQLSHTTLHTNHPTHSQSHLRVDTASQSPSTNLSHEAVLQLVQDLLTNNNQQQQQHYYNQFSSTVSNTPVHSQAHQIHQAHPLWNQQHQQQVSMSAPTSLRSNSHDHMSSSPAVDASCVSLLSDSALVRCPIAMCAVSSDGLIAEGNSAFLTLFNIPSATHLSRFSLFSLVHPTTISLLLTWMNEIVAGATSKQGQITARKLSAEAILSPIGGMIQPARDAFNQDSHTVKRSNYQTHTRLHLAVDTAAYAIYQQLKSKSHRVRGQQPVNIEEITLTDGFLSEAFPLTPLCIQCHFIVAPIRDSDGTCFAYHLTIEPLSDQDFAPQSSMSNIHEVLKQRMLTFEPNKKRKRKATSIVQPTAKAQKVKMEEKGNIVNR